MTRSISPSPVPAGVDEVTVTVRINGEYGVGSVEETLPTGFTYVDGSADITPTEDGLKLSFPLVGETSFSYKVNTSSTADVYWFSGKLTYGVAKKETPTVRTSVEVQQAQQSSVSMTRSISPSPVPAGVDEVTVTVRINGEYGVGSVEETLPTGFTYVDGSADITPTEDGLKLSFPLVGETSFSYKVNTSSTADVYWFSGKLTYGVAKKETPTVRTSVEVQQAQQSSVSMTRSISPSPVPAGVDEVTVTVRINGEYGVGSVEETLPTGFTYVDGSADITPTEDGLKLSFPLVGETSFSYKVNTSSTADVYWFSGKLTYGVAKKETPTVRTSVRVGSPPPPPTQNRAPAFSGSSTTRSIDENSAAGANVGARVSATDRDGDRLTYALSGTDASSFTINSSGQIMVGTGTMLDYETKASYSVTVRATDPDGDSDTITVTVAVVNVNEDGMVTLSEMRPRVGAAVTAMLSDDDEPVAGTVMWQWASSDPMAGTFADIAGATSASYTPVEGDVDMYLVAMAMYDDGHGTGKEAMMVTANPVIAAPDDACLEPLGMLPMTVMDAWASDCESEAKSGSYARYYSFTLASDMQVEMNLTSGADSYLALRQGERQGRGGGGGERQRAKPELQLVHQPDAGCRRLHRRSNDLLRRANRGLHAVGAAAARNRGPGSADQVGGPQQQQVDQRPHVHPTGRKLRAVLHLHPGGGNARGHQPDRSRGPLPVPAG